MELTKLLNSDDERAVSPVIGVILMVAITVILAAVIGTFVLGLGDQVRETSPNAQWTWEQSQPSALSSATGNYQATVTQEGGQNVDPSSLSLTIASDNTPTTYDIKSASNWDGTNSNDMIVAGTSFEVIDTSAGTPVGLDQGDEVTVTWQSPDGGTSSTLTTFQIS